MKVNTTDSEGRFHWEGTYNQTVTLVLNKTGYHFSPANIPIQRLVSDMPNILIQAERDRLTISGRVLNSNNTPISGVTVKLTQKNKTLTNTN